MSLVKQRIKVLSEQAQCCALQERHARQRLRAGRSRFFSNPTNLLLPFCSGMLVAARFSRRAASANQGQAGSKAGTAGGKTAWLSVAINALSTGFRFYTRYLAANPEPDPESKPASQPANGGAERVSARSRMVSAEAPGASAAVT